MRRALAICRTVVLLAAAAAAVAAVAQQAPLQQPRELQAWLEAQPGSAGRPKRLGFHFGSADSRRLEALSIALVERGFEIVRLADGALLVAREEPFTGQSLARLDRTLNELAQAHGTSYRGFDLLGLR
jgi:hypothetical protein